MQANQSVAYGICNTILLVIILYNSINDIDRGVIEMSKLVIDGGRRLEGEIIIQGAKNSVLPILAATVLNSGKNIVHNCPKLRDVDMTVKVLEGLGCSVEFDGNTVIVDSSCLSDCRIDESLMRQMRSSIIFLGAIIARMGEAVVSMPGGCEIGARPIDLHLKALRRLGVHITEKHGYLHCKADSMNGARIHLDFPSVGATENIMLAAALANGTTIITNAAREPEIVDLQEFLNRMGAKISGAGGSVIRIDGVKELYPVEHRIIPDRIAAATYLAAGAATAGCITVKNVCSSHMSAMLHILTEMGNRIIDESDRITIIAPKRLNCVSNVRTMPYPGFPTDIQSPFMTLACIANGTSVITETIFENRFRNAEELRRMGANINTDGRTAVIIGVDRLNGANVVAGELRGGASLIVAGLCANGTTTVDKCEFIDRGYEEVEKKLTDCGAVIERFE